MENKDIIKTVLMLDIDGCITSARTGWHIWDVSAVHFINWVCKQTNAKIVITSTWRLNHDKTFFEQFFGDNLHETWKTIDLGEGYMRGDEIFQWLSHNPNITQYLILDDDVDMLDCQIDSFRKTSSFNGLLYNDMQWICDYFDLPPYNADAINKELQNR